MKKLTALVLLFVGMTAMAQIKGNGTITTKVYPTLDLEDLRMNLYAQVTIDQNAKSVMTITTDSNLHDLIDTEIVSGTLKLEQKEWIQASRKIEITIGAPLLKRLEVGVHETVVFKNVNQERLSLMALNGKIKVSGVSTNAGMGAENGDIDGKDLQTNNVYLNIWGNGKAIVNATDLIESKLGESGQIELVSTPKKFKGDGVKKEKANRFAKAKYIDIKIKNNSWNRNHFAVKGPKQDGRYFGYGFPMMPGAVKKERWTVGTKIYKVNKIGLKKLLVEITAEDEGKMVSLFKD